MSYDLGVWEGPPPADAAAAGTELERRAELPAEPPTPAIRAFVDALVERYPDDEEHLDESPWSVSPLIADASGAFIYLTMSHTRAAEAAGFVGAKAAEAGLVCFDPQKGRLLDGSRRKRFRLPARSPKRGTSSAASGKWIVDRQL